MTEAWGHAAERCSGKLDRLRTRRPAIGIAAKRSYDPGPTGGYLHAGGLAEALGQIE
jgi:hypothetical protein